MTQDQGQDLLGYLCKCGFKDTDKGKFSKHLLDGGHKDGKGVHKSMGRVNMATGEIVMPPFAQRSTEQIVASRFALKKKGTQDTSDAIRQTEIYQDATQVKFVPRVLVASFTPIMYSGKTAAERLWGWRPDMPFENFLDTIIIHFFRDRGIELASFVVTNPQEHEEIRRQNLSTQNPESEEIKEAVQ